MKIRLQLFLVHAARHLIFFSWVLLLLWPTQASAQQQPKTYGILEHWVYAPEVKQIQLRGWVLAGENGENYPVLKLSILGEKIQAQDILWAERPDVTASSEVTGGQISRGFSFAVAPPSPLPPGVHLLRLEAVYANGMRTELPFVFDGPPYLAVKLTKVPGRHIWILLIVLLAAGLILIFQKKRGHNGVPDFSRKVDAWTSAGRVYVVCGMVFLVLVATGVTGSSFGVMLKGPFGKSLIDVVGSQSRIFSLRDVRGDEWGVLTPHSLAQLHHDPQFPIVNSHVGTSGQNMGVMHMTAVPVQQWAALARPATWGYFVLPLRQAMSWQWQLPFWGCLLALWAMLNVLRPERRGLNLALSTVFCVAPYAAAWSNWPLYATMFPALAFVLVSKILRTTHIRFAAVWGLALGWAMASWALILYPTWIIVIASALLFVGLGWCADQRTRLHWGIAQWLSMALAIGVVAALLGSWWLDSRDAISLMRATVYPGARGAIPGGDLSGWMHLRGYSNAETVLRTSGPATNQSEISSYFLLPLVLVVLVMTNIFRPAVRRWAIAGCGLFLLCYWVYSIVGVPIWLARYSLWGNMPSVRMDVGMGLVSVILFALAAPALPAARQAGQAPKTDWRLPGLVAAGSAGLIVWALWSMPLLFMPRSSVVYMVAMALAGAFISWFMMRGRAGAAVAMLLVVHLLTTLAFNPVSRAPRSVELAAGHRPYVADPEDSSRLLPTLVLHGDGIGPMALAAVGIPVVNGVLHYPQKAFWERMGLMPTEWDKVNRYQHLGFYLAPDIEASAAYRVFVASVDQVHVHVHPVRFDFSRTGAARVAVPDEHAPALAGNPSLKHLGQHRGLHWFAVRDAPTAEVALSKGD